MDIPWAKGPDVYSQMSWWIEFCLLEVEAIHASLESKASKREGEPCLIYLNLLSHLINMY